MALFAAHKIPPISGLIRQVMETSEVRDWIIQANQDQLAKHGEDSKRKVLQTYKAASGFPYAPLTIDLKSLKSGLSGIYDRVTLYDSGQFYSTFRTLISDMAVEIVANFRNISDNLDITDVLGLNEDNISILAQEIVYPKLMQLIKTT